MIANNFYPKVVLLAVFVMIGILSYSDFRFEEQMMASLLLYILCCRVVYLTTLKQPIIIWWEKTEPGAPKYRVAKVFAAFGLLFIIYRAYLGIIRIFA